MLRLSPLCLLVFVGTLLASSEKIPDPPRAAQLVSSSASDELDVLESYEKELAPDDARCRGAPVMPAESSFTEESQAAHRDRLSPIIRPPIEKPPCFHLEYVCRQHCVKVYDYVPYLTSPNDCPAKCSRVRKVVRLYCWHYHQAVLRPCRCELDVCLMLDHSGSLNSYTNHIKQAYGQILSSIFSLPNMSPQIAVVSHDPIATTSFTNSLSTLTSIVNNIESGNPFVGGDEFPGSMVTCEKYFHGARPNSRRIAFTITDGADPANVANIENAAHSLRFNPNPHVDTYCLYVPHPSSYWHANGEQNSREIGKAAGRFLEIINPNSWSSYLPKVNEFIRRIRETCQPDYVYPPIPKIDRPFGVEFKIGECPPEGIDDREAARGGDSSSRCYSRTELQMLDGEVKVRY